MSDQTPEPAGNLWTMLLEGNWLKVPGAVRAISRLVTGTSDALAAQIGISTAKGEQRQQEIRDETKARSVVTQSLARAAAKQIVGNEALAERAIGSWITDRLRKQKNADSVARLTVQELEYGPLLSHETEGPSEDWMNVFAPFVEQASSQRMQETWARILAGEVRKPGSFSLRTLAFVSTLDQASAEDIVAATGALVNHSCIPSVGKFGEGSAYTQLLNLSEMGFLVLGSSLVSIVSDDGKVAFKIGPTSVFIFEGKSSQRISIPGEIVSKVGLEIISIMTIEPDIDQISTILDMLRTTYDLALVDTVPISSVGPDVSRLL